MPGLYILKSTIWVFCAVISLQGIALIARRTLFLKGRDEHSPEKVIDPIRHAEVGA